MYRENLKMGKVIRGVERGKCAFGECDDFMRSDEQPVAIVATCTPLPTRQPYPDYNKLPNFLYLRWSETPSYSREPDDFQPRAQIKRLFEESKLVSGDSEAIGEFSNKFIVPQKLVADKNEQREEEETEREGRERLNREYNDT